MNVLFKTTFYMYCKELRNMACIFPVQSCGPNLQIFDQDQAVRRTATVFVCSECQNASAALLPQLIKILLFYMVIFYPTIFIQKAYGFM